MKPVHQKDTQKDHHRHGDSKGKIPEDLLNIPFNAHLSAPLRSLTAISPSIIKNDPKTHEPNPSTKNRLP
jgi:hypothetical protein